MTAIKPNTVKVKFNNRIFFVDFDNDKKALRIKELKSDKRLLASFWNAKVHQLSERSIANQIIQKALKNGH